jgi:predicted RNA-binding Zn-ribbon protein involved in translation (DUF1610 family)
MLKFQCQHCGRRIAVPSRNLGKLVTCSECGMQTHPLAEQIAAAAPNYAPAPAPAPAAAPARTAAATGAAPGACDNCGATIGRLETSHSWGGHVVCGGCHGRLAGESRAGVAPVAAPVSPLVVPAAHVTRALPARSGDSDAFAPPKPVVLELRERVLRALIVFVVASVALYGALSLLRDIAGLIAVAAVAVIALLALYVVFRGSVAARRAAAAPTALAALRRDAA